MMKRPMMKKGGKALKPVKPNQKGLSKLPKDVRNKMGYMKKGGRVGLQEGGDLNSEKIKQLKSKFEENNTKIEKAKKKLEQLKRVKKLIGNK